MVAGEFFIISIHYLQMFYRHWRNMSQLSVIHFELIIHRLRLFLKIERFVFIEQPNKSAIFSILQVTIQPSIGIMATRNPYAINPNNDHRMVLSSEIRSRFRIVSLVKPELDQIFRIKCFEHNLKNPNNIAEKISLLYESIRLYL